MTIITREQAQKIIDAADNVITALAGTNDDFHPDNSEKMCGLWDDLNDRYAPPEVVRELARAMLASLTAEPVRYLNKFSGTYVTLEQQPNAADDVAVYIPLYAAPPVQETGVYKDMLNIIGLLESNEWAEHCTSTVLGSLLESEITRLVGKEQPAPVVPEECPADISVLMASHSDALFNDDDAQEIWNACRAVMLQSQYRDLSQPVDPQISEYEKIMLRAGWVMVPVEPTDEMIAAAMECDDVVFDSKDPTAFCVQYREIYCAMVDTAPKQEGNNG